ncbi:MAG: periplasmic flagellar collar protein FlcA [Treponema sp.]
MPGLSQLNKFNSDILSLGNEAELRAQRGEKLVSLPIPKSVKDIDDSDDFVMGISDFVTEPAIENKNTAEEEDFSDITGAPSQPEGRNVDTVDVDLPGLSSLMGQADGNGNNTGEIPDLSMFLDEPETAEQVQEEKEPDIADLSLDDLLGGSGFDGTQGTAAEDEPFTTERDFSSGAQNAANELENGSEQAFDESVLHDSERSSQTQNMSAIPSLEDALGLGGDENAAPSDETEAVSDTENFNLDGGDFDLDFPADDLPDLDAPPAQAGGAASDSGVNPGEMFSLDDLQSLSEAAAADTQSEPEVPAGADTNGLQSDNDGGDEGGAEQESFADTFQSDTPLEEPVFDAPPETQDTAAEPVPDTMENAADTEDASIMPGQMFSLDDLNSLSDSADADGGEAGAENEAFMTSGGGLDFSDFDAPDGNAINLGSESPELDDFDMQTGAEPSLASDDNAVGGDTFSLPDGNGADALSGDNLSFSAEDFNLPEDGAESSQNAGANGAPDTGGVDFSAIDFDDDGSDSFGMDSGAVNLGGDENSASTQEGKASDDFPAGFDFDLSEGASDDAAQMPADENAPIETFDASELSGMEFPETDAQLGDGGGFELDNSGDIKLDSGDFEIRGFTDVDTVAEGKNGKMKVPETAALQESAEGDLPENTLSDADYRKFLNNLSSYPLNVRLAVEDLIIKNEFTDDAEFGIVQKVLKKVSARQLAAELEKMLDISIPVPRDFERRTAAEYEAYKASFQYQLRNKIIPGALMSMIGAVLVWLLFMFSKFYIYEPAMANHLYRQGYNLLEAGNYPPSEEKFNKAVTYNLQKKWFFKYARGYRAHKQYARAEQVYKALLYAFKFDKTAGLEYAEMEMNDLANYVRAEEIVLRDVLDHHVNDPDGILLLGDVYLEWATEKDPSKFDLARARYSELIETNKVKSKNLFYLSRMLRYYIRTDNLLQVLQLKENFMPKAKSLGAEDWTELSGYLLDKLYGQLAPSDEYLRNKIEDVKETLVRAVKANESNPVAFYNMSRYYVQMNDSEKAKEALSHTINLFDKARTVKRRDIYKNIDSYRLLGEEYTAEREYIKALEAYTGGISLFTEQHDASGLPGNEQVGKLYGDMGDIEFFVSGENDSALLSYQDAVDNFNDTPEIRYKIGYIQYGKKNYAEALGSFMKALEDEHSDQNLLMAMGNTLSMRDDNYAAQGYYERLMEYLDAERAQRGVLFPQTRSDEQEIVDLYLKASNNLGVTLYRLAKRTGDSSLNAQAMVNFQESMRAWDALTRNQTTMVRLGGSNLAEQNMKYVSHPLPDYEPAIYTALPRTLSGEKEFGK